MSEKHFQMALLHLYKTIDHGQVHTDGMFAQFALSNREKQWLRELVESQRDALLMFNAQLHDKQRRFIRQALAVSRRACGERLEALLGDYIVPAGLTADTSDAAVVRGFADHVARREPEVEHRSREAELIRFEALLVAMSFGPVPSDRPSDPSDDCRLWLGEDAHLILCNHDVVAVMRGEGPLATAHRLAVPKWFLLFADAVGATRTLAVAPGLARVLTFFGEGDDQGQVLRRLGGEAERALAQQGVAKLMELGVPFSSSKAPRRVQGRVA